MDSDRRPKVGDSLKIDGIYYIVDELFKASDTRWVRTINVKREENKYFTEHEWTALVAKYGRR